MVRLKRRKREKFGTRQETRVRCKEHLQFVRGHVCAVLGKGPNGHRCAIDIVEAAHVRTGTDGALSKKPGDNWTIPLCAYAHSVQHAWGEAAFEKHFGIDMKALAAQLWQRSPHRIKYERREQRA